MNLTNRLQNCQRTRHTAKLIQFTYNNNLHNKKRQQLNEQQQQQQHELPAAAAAAAFAGIVADLKFVFEFELQAGGRRAVGEVNLCRDLITKWLPVTVTSTVDIRYVPVLAMAKQKFSPVVLGKLMNLLCKIDN